MGRVLINAAFEPLDNSKQDVSDIGHVRFEVGNIDQSTRIYFVLTVRRDRLGLSTICVGLRPARARSASRSDCGAAAGQLARPLIHTATITHSDGADRQHHRPWRRRRVNVCCLGH
jgi:hypothetical protein